METVNRWRASNFERGAVEDVLADDVEWVVPNSGGVSRVRGIDAVLEWYASGGAADELLPDESLDFSEERGELEDFGDGRVGSLNRLIYTSKESGEVAYVKTHRLVYTVRDGKIVRYELENVDESELERAPVRLTRHFWRLIGSSRYARRTETRFRNSDSRPAGSPASTAALMSLANISCTSRRGKWPCGVSWRPLCSGAS